MKLYKGLIPWGPTGPLDYLDSGQTSVYDINARGNVPIVFKDNTPFQNILIPLESFRGRSAAGFTFTIGYLPPEVSPKFTMRLSCMEDFLKRGYLKDGATGYHTWAFTKQGANFSLMLVES